MFLLLLLLAGLQGIVAAQTRPLTSRDFGSVLDDSFQNRRYNRIFNTDEVIGKKKSIKADINDNDYEFIRSNNGCANRSNMRKYSCLIVLDSEKAEKNDLCLSYDNYEFPALYYLGQGRWDILIDHKITNLACSPAMKKLLREKYGHKLNQELKDTKQIESELNEHSSKLALLPESVVNTESSVNIN